MNPNLIGLFSVGLSVAAFASVYVNLRRRTRAIRLVVSGIFVLLAIPSILFAVYYLHILPERAWFYTLRSWSGSELLIVFLGGATGAFATLLPRSLLLLPLCTLVAIAIVPYIKPLVGPLADSEFAERWDGDTCLQSTSSTCGPASVSTILRRLGAKTTERETARAAYTYAGGTEAWYLARYVRSKGFVPRFDFRKTFHQAGLPAVVGVRFGNVGHFIAVLDVNGDQITFADPLRGEERLSISQFQKRYDITGFRMVITKH